MCSSTLRWVRLLAVAGVLVARAGVAAAGPCVVCVACLGVQFLVFGYDVACDVRRRASPSRFAAAFRDRSRSELAPVVDSHVCLLLVYWCYGLRLRRDVFLGRESRSVRVLGGWYAQVIPKHWRILRWCIVSSVDPLL